MLARFTFARNAGGWRVQRAEFVPTLVQLGTPIRLLDLTAEPPSARVVEALERTDDVVLSRGAGRAGLTRPQR